MLPESPILTLFVFLQIIGIAQYLLKKRLDALKDVTWGLIDEGHSKTMEKLSERFKKMNETLSKSIREALSQKRVNL